jgi:DNA modification methylase
MMLDERFDILAGHCLDVLKEVPDQSVQCCITSPPYWGLRDYGDTGQAWPTVSYRPLPGLSEVDVPAQVAALGLEPEPYHYVAHLVAVFREARRVLKPDGTLWLNLGDLYASSVKGSCGTGKSGG